MGTKIQDNISTMGSSAAATAKTRYSAKELADMMNTHPEELFNVDIAACTDWYTNEDYLEELMSYVVDEERIDSLIEFIRMMHEYQTINQHHPKVCHPVPDKRKYAPYVEDLNEKLCAIRVRVLHAREVAAQMEEMKKRWSAMSTTATCRSSLEAHPAQHLHYEQCETQPPSFSDDSTDNTIDYHMDDLPNDVRSQILIEEDTRYSLFVNDLLGPVKEWVDRHRKQDWNVVRFICRLRGIVAKHCSLNIFGRFLEHIGLGNQESNMKQRKDANDKNALIAYDDPKNVNSKFFRLKREGKEIEELLADVIDEEAA